MRAASTRLLKFISSICGHRHFVFPAFEDIQCVRAVKPVCPVDIVCQAVLPSAAGSYITALITATRITCSALADTHSFSPAFPRSVAISSSLPTLVSSPPNLSYFHLAQLNALLNALFPSVSFHYPSLLPLPLLFLLLSLWPHPKIPSLSLLVSPVHSFSLSSLSVTIYLPSPSKSFVLSLALRLGSSSNITNAIAYWLGAKSARR